VESTRVRVQSVPEALDEITQLLRQAGITCEICGKIRRKWPSIDYDYTGVIVAISTTQEIHRVLARYHPKTTKTKPNTTLVFVGDIGVYVYATTEEAWGAALIYYTGPGRFRKCLCTEANEQGLKLTVSGLWQGKYRIAGRTEEQIFACLGKEYIPPEKRKHFTTERRKKKNLMRENAITERKMVYKAILQVFSERIRGSLPVKRSEIQKALTEWMLESEIEVALGWLQRHGLITKTKGGWLPNKLPETGVCWIHGRALPCYTCKRIEERKIRAENAKQKRDLRNLIKESENVILGLCGTGN